MTRHGGRHAVLAAPPYTIWLIREWRVIDASGTSEQTVKQCPDTDRTSEAAKGPDSARQSCRHPRNQDVKPHLLPSGRSGQRHHPAPRLNAEMASDTAFRMIAGRDLRGMTADHEATCRGDPEALHRMRLALTRLRTAILFFSPMIDDTKRVQIKSELKVAEQPAWRRARSGRRDAATRGRQQAPAASTALSSVLERTARGQPSPSGASASLSQVSAPD